jgi:hypothetical protein
MGQQEWAVLKMRGLHAAIRAMRVAADEDRHGHAI